MKPFSVLVIGANGYIGSHIVKTLKQEGIHRVIGLKNRNSVPFSKISQEQDTLFYTPTQDKIAELKEEVFDVIIYAAGVHEKSGGIHSYHSNVNANLAFGVQVLESLRDKPKLFIYTNSYSAFTNQQINVPDGLYGASKKAFTAFLEYFYQTFGISVLNCHLYDTYGYGDKRKKVIDLYIDAALTSSPIDTSLGNREMNFVYIDDIAKSICKSISLYDENTSFFKNYCIYGNEVLTLKQLRELIEELTGKKIIVRDILPDKEPLEFVPLYPLLPTFECTTSLRQGIQKLIQDRGAY